ncbi:hypothetical protein P3X46_021659 [Hevea brasiliensis]|uniref:Late embryogenesis abundant protein, LEA-18 n=1 Tax=Hevea brasiliensis TaxID=3981 RepID=A0ABQ9LI87_HEVBR|nr:uncharacterized protein LOC110654315 [Hevea brasiliensis]KAJ9166970.1 hypothetical protein P3X46_021659 [Hevea brasiliensis]
MENSSEQMARKTDNEDKNKEGLPLESSPYLKYSDLEDYKRQAYGTEGHQEVKPNQRGGGTDAPTLSEASLPDGKPQVS